MALTKCKALILEVLEEHKFSTVKPLYKDPLL
jgi:hypothetical protein